MQYRLALFFIILGISLAQTNALATETVTKPITGLSDISLLAQRGLSDKTILIFLKNRKIDFELSANNIDFLAQAGVSEDIIQYLIQQQGKQPIYIPVPTVQYVDTYPRTYYTPYYSAYVNLPLSHHGYAGASYTFAHNPIHSIGRHHPRHGISILPHNSSSGISHGGYKAKHYNQHTQYNTAGLSVSHNGQAKIIHNRSHNMRSGSHRTGYRKSHSSRSVHSSGYSSGGHRSGYSGGHSSGH